MIEQIIKKLANKQNLTFDEAGEVIEFFAEGKATPEQISTFLISLKSKGETAEEISGFATKMRELTIKINTDGINNIVDSCGTGGDRLNTFNISTASAILASSSGLHIAKHSNFGFTSKCGSSNVLESLGIELVKTSKDAEISLQNHNIVFLHAPYFHKSTSHVNPVRKQLGIGTVFNFLGPLTNPARPTGQVLGISNPDFLPKMVESLKNLGCKKALVVCGSNPAIDEISICGKTHVYRLNNGNIDNFELHPEDLGLKAAKIEDIQGGTPDINAQIIKDIFDGKLADSKLNAVILNTAGLLWVGNKAESLEEGVKISISLIESGLGSKKLQEISKQKHY